MAETARMQKLWEGLTTVPDTVPRDLARYVIYWKIFYALAGLSHLMALWLFQMTGVTFMAVFNIFSVAVFIAASILVRTGYYRIAYWLAFSELTLHGIAATICVGALYGHANYVFLVPILAFIQPFYSWRFASLVVAATLASGGWVTWYALTHPPIYVVPDDQAVPIAVMAIVTWPIYVLVMVLPFIRASARAEKELAAAYEESEHLLLNILPAPIAERLKTTSGMIADDREKVAILFTDIVGFTHMSGTLKPGEVVTLLNGVFNAIDGLVTKYGLEKIKTIGDAYMVVAGLPDPVDDPEVRIARLALEIREKATEFSWPGTGETLSVRIGFNVGSVVAGVIGNRKFAYDLWGDAVNVAARMEATGEPGRIQVTEEVARTLEDRFAFEPRGEVEIKGKGRVATCFLIGERKG